jgi:hypothetical protein
VWVQGAIIYTMYNYHDSRAYGYKRSGILFGLVGIGLVWLWMGMGMGLIGDLSRLSENHES